MRLSTFAPYSDNSAPSVRRLLLGAAPWMLVAGLALYALLA